MILPFDVVKVTVQCQFYFAHEADSFLHRGGFVTVTEKKMYNIEITNVLLHFMVYVFNAKHHKLTHLIPYFIYYIFLAVLVAKWLFLKKIEIFFLEQKNGTICLLHIGN